MENNLQQLLDFIEKSPTCYHAVAEITQILIRHHYSQLIEGTQWDIRPNQGYFIIRNGASIIAFKAGDQLLQAGFHIVASHNDSPAFKLKPNGVIVEKNYVKWNTEPYGGMLMATWMDRPLGIAGRILVQTANGIASRLIKEENRSVIIPNVAIHLNREANSGINYNAQVDLLPIVTTDTFSMETLWQTKLQEMETVLAHDLFLYNKERGQTIGYQQEWFSAPHIDDLECTYTSLQGFLQADNHQDINVFAVFNHEEVGSQSNHGAASTFLSDTLTHIGKALQLDVTTLYKHSLLVSADNAHAIHPNHPEKSDPTNYVCMNNGIVIKHQAGLSYTTDAISSSIFQTILNQGAIPYQFYTNRSDLRGGGTLGSISLSQVSIHSIDIGLAQLAMHSSYETAGTQDVIYMINGLKQFYKTHFTIEQDKIIVS